MKPADHSSIYIYMISSLLAHEISYHIQRKSAKLGAAVNQIQNIYSIFGPMEEMEKKEP